MSNCVDVWALFGNNAAHLFQLRNNSHTCIETIHAIELSACAIHDTVFIHDHHEWDVVTNCHLKVIGIMSCSDFYSACSKIRINKFVSNDGYHAIDERQQDFGANHVLIARVIRVNCNCAIAHHGLGTSSCNHNTLLAISVTNLNKLACIIVVFYFNI